MPRMLAIWTASAHIPAVTAGTELLELFIAACPRAAHHDRSEISRALVAACDAAHDAWPEIKLSDHAFVQHMGVTSQDGLPVAIAQARDLYLACACAHSNRAALRAFDEILRPAVARAVRRMDASNSFRDLVVQELRTRLLAGPTPKISEYSGRAPLAAWLKTVAIRAALNLRRGKAEQEAESVSANLKADDAGPEARLTRARFDTELRAALELALTHLSTQERAVLCLNVRDGLSIDKLAVVYGVGRSTAARWLSAARQTIERETRSALASRMKLTPSELDSLVRDVRSHIEISLAGLLETT